MHARPARARRARACVSSANTHDGMQSDAARMPIASVRIVLRRPNIHPPERRSTAGQRSQHTSVCAPMHMPMYASCPLTHAGEAGGRDPGALGPWTARQGHTGALVGDSAAHGGDASGVLRAARMARP
eukprot:355543-Chlamydomonas_euryale.AAC.5